MDFNLVFIFKFALKRTLTSFKFFFCVFKIYIINLIHFFSSKSDSIYYVIPYKNLFFSFHAGRFFPLQC